MTWQVLVFLVALMTLVAALGAWILWLVHDSEPSTDE